MGALVVLVVATSACLDDSITGVRELSIVLVASRTSVSAGDSVRFEYLAQGTGLVSVHFAYGDGGADTVPFSGGFEVPDYGEPEDHANTDTVFYAGPLEVAGALTHAFHSSGTFPVIGHAVGATGVVSDTVRVTVN